MTLAARQAVMLWNKHVQ